MKTSLAFAFAILVTATSALAQFNYYDSSEAHAAHTNFYISDVRLVSVVSKTEIRDIPGCNPNGEASTICTEEVVLERQPVVRVTVSYTEGVFPDPERRDSSYMNFNLNPASFSAEDLAELELASRGFWDLSGRQFRARKVWGKMHVELQTKLVTRTIQIVDVRNSRLCPEGEAGPQPGCVEVLNYKPSKIKVREVKIVVK